MTTLPAHQPLNDALQKFEMALEAPVVPGELVEWTQSAQAALEELAHQERRQLVAVHQQEFAEIAHQDPGMLWRVEQMQDEDAAIGRALQEAQSGLAALNQRAEAVQSDEAAAEPLRREMVDRGLELVIRIRKQEAAAKTWLAESLQRDRGVVD